MGELESVEDLSVVLLLKSSGSESSLSAYSYVSIPLDKFAEFSVAFNSGKGFDISEYGKIVFSGFGEPDEEVKRHMTDEYGFDHENPMVLE